LIAVVILGAIAIVALKAGPEILQSYVAFLVKLSEGSSTLSSPVLLNLVFVGVMAALFVGFDAFLTVTRAILWFAVWALRGTQRALDNLPIHPPERRWWLILIITFVLSRASLAVPLPHF
jgi:hypothetical protein